MKKFYLFLLIFLLLLGFASFGVFIKRHSYANVYKEEIAKARAVFDDDYSLEVYDTLIKYHDLKHKFSFAKLNKNLLEKFPEHYHPNVPISLGDYVIDGGVSEYLDVTFDFLEKIGETGFLYGFEPNITVKDVIENGLKPYSNVKMEYKALWDKNEKMTLYLGKFSDSRLKTNEEFTYYNEIVVDTITIDSFAEQENFKKLDIIKLDIEGAELEALKGAEKNIRKFKPKMIISAYHFPEDIFQIINYINSLNLGYKFWLGYHLPYSDRFANVILYAKVEN